MSIEVPVDTDGLTQALPLQEVVQEVPRASTRIQSLDGLRALSIIFVLLDHLGTSATKSKLLFVLARIFGSGYLGVYIFFVISGYLITTLLLKEQSRFGKISLSQFYLRRAIRIWPVFYTMLGVVALLGALHVIPMMRPIMFLVSGFFISNFNLLFHHISPKSMDVMVGHIWSLSTEEQFYLFWPLALSLCSRKNAFRIAIVIICIEPLIRTGLYFAFPKYRDAIAFLGIARADSLMFGCLAALLSSSERFQQFLKKAWSYHAQVYAAVFALVISQLIVLFLKSSCIAYEVTVGMTLDGIAITLVILWAISAKDNLAIKLLNSKPLVWIGTLSYGIYVWQQMFLMYHSSSPLNRWPLNLIAAIFVATVSYYLLEKPCLRLKRLIRDPRDARG